MFTGDTVREPLLRTYQAEDGSNWPADQPAQGDWPAEAPTGAEEWMGSAESAGQTEWSTAEDTIAPDDQSAEASTGETDGSASDNAGGQAAWPDTEDTPPQSAGLDPAGASDSNQAVPDASNTEAEIELVGDMKVIITGHPAPMELDPSTISTTIDPNDYQLHSVLEGGFPTVISPGRNCSSILDDGTLIDGNTTTELPLGGDTGLNAQCNTQVRRRPSKSRSGTSRGARLEFQPSRTLRSGSVMRNSVGQSRPRLGRQTP